MRIMRAALQEAGAGGRPLALLIHGGYAAPRMIGSFGGSGEWNGGKCEHGHMVGVILSLLSGKRMAASIGNDLLRCNWRNHSLYLVL